MSNKSEANKKVFISYQFGEDEDFITSVCYFLKKQNGMDVYFHKEAPIPEKVSRWRDEIYSKITEANSLAYFYSSTPIGVRKEELDEAIRNNKLIIIIKMPNIKIDCTYNENNIRTIIVNNRNEEDALQCAHNISKLVTGKWIPEDDIPNGYIFNYEKEIIDTYLSKDINLNLISQGCPKEWPDVFRKDSNHKNPINDEDIYRDKNEENPYVVVASLSKYSPIHLDKSGMTFPLAGPRKMVHYNKKNLQKIGILVSGGIAPGINAVISAILDRHLLYASNGNYMVECCGFLDGFKSLINGTNPIILDPKHFKANSNKGGSFLGTSRMPEFVTGTRTDRYAFFEEAADVLRCRHINILYVIGGDGSMRAVHALWKALGSDHDKISIVAIPKTMDNDVLWGWQTFGFESAVERADEFINQLYVEAVSNPRLCVLQLFGSDSGYVVTHATLAASGLCDLFLIPEVPFTMNKVVKYMKDKIYKRHYDIIHEIKIRNKERPYGMVIMAETAIPLDAMRYVDSIDLLEDEIKAVKNYLQLELLRDKPLSLNETEYNLFCEYIGFTKSNTLIQSISNEDTWNKINKILSNHSKKLRTFGQTPDLLRSAGLKLVSKVLEKELKQAYEDLRVFTNEPRHLLRSLPPRSSDVLLGQRLGTLAVDCAMAGYTDFMISQWLTEYVMIPLRLVVLGRKRIPKTGIFYKSAIASTEQPDNLIT